MTVQTIGRLAVPGAILHYEVTGSGPVLLLIPGGETDAGVFDAMIEQLAMDYTVVAYDPRGNSRSRYDGEPADERVDVSADDALAVLDAVAGAEPAFVFGMDCGAITALALIARYPQRVRLLVAHEPPAVELLADPETPRAFLQDVYDTYRRDGAAAADRLFAGGTGMDEDELPRPEDLRPEFHEVMQRAKANKSNYFEHKLLPFTRYRPEVDALVEVAGKIVPAAGAGAAGHLPAQPIAALSEQLGWPVVVFPGDHCGYASHPVEFATLLARLFEAEDFQAELS